jgi:hypothetical protein
VIRGTLAPDDFVGGAPHSVRYLVLALPIPASPRSQGHAADTRCRPQDDLGIAMLTDDVRVHGMRIDMEDVTDDVFEPCRVEHRAGPDDSRGRQPRNCGHVPGQNIYGIADHHDGSARPCESSSDVANHRRILAEQIQPGFAWSTAAAGRDDDDVGIGHVFDGRCANQRPRIER